MNLPHIEHFASLRLSNPGWHVPVLRRAVCTRLLGALCATTTSVTARVAAQAHIGHRFEVIPDSSRTYTTSAGGGARPVQLMLWYPATQSHAPRLALRDYIRAAPSQDEARSAAALRHYRATFGRDSSPVVQPETLAAFLETPAGAASNASPAPGRHPALLLQTGLNAPAYLLSELAESLAQSGFVVAVMASFGHSADAPLNFDSSGVATQLADLRHALLWLRGQSFVDRDRVGVGGWSIGSVSAFVLAAEDVARFRAVISLDGGFGYDYGGPLVEQFGIRPPCVTTPLLHVTGTQPSVFRVAKSRGAFDGLPPGHAFWATIPGLGHAEFTSHMGSRSPLLATRPDRAQVIDGTRRLERTATSFLRRYLAGTLSEWTSDRRESAEEPPNAVRRCDSR